MQRNNIWGRCTLSKPEIHHRSSSQTSWHRFARQRGSIQRPSEKLQLFWSTFVRRLYHKLKYQKLRYWFHRNFCSVYSLFIRNLLGTSIKSIKIFYVVKLFNIRLGKIHQLRHHEHLGRRWRQREIQGVLKNKMLLESKNSHQNWVLWGQIFSKHNLEAP